MVVQRVVPTEENQNSVKMWKNPLSWFAEFFGSSAPWDLNRTPKLGLQS